MCLLACQAIIAHGADYVGSSECRTCHRNAYEQWQDSDHFRSMQPATDKSVLGKFNGMSVEFHGVSSRLFKTGDRFFIETEIIDYNFIRKIDVGKGETFHYYQGFTKSEFIPKLDHENLEWKWASQDEIPKPLYPDMQEKIDNI